MDWMFGFLTGFGIGGISTAFYVRKLWRRNRSAIIAAWNRDLQEKDQWFLAVGPDAPAQEAGGGE